MRPACPELDLDLEQEQEQEQGERKVTEAPNPGAHVGVDLRGLTSDGDSRARVSGKPGSCRVRWVA